MGNISSQFPFTDPGSLQGGIREHRAVLNGLQSDAFRSASQTQEGGQNARAFSGSDVDNVNIQDGAVDQFVNVDNVKTLTIDPVTSLVPPAAAPGFDYNYMQRYIAGADAADYLARGAANIAQDQRGDQNGYAELMDFDGVDSNAKNKLTQNADIKQRFDVDLDADVNVKTDATTVADTDDSAFQASRFRTIEADISEQSAQAIFTSGQRQGSVDSPSFQGATGNGADTKNVLTQNATVTQTRNTVDLKADYDLRRIQADALAPRTTDLIAKMNNNSAINSSAASQEQVLMQSAQGAVHEEGMPTENGIDTVVKNVASSTADNTESTRVTNDVRIRI